MLGQSEPFMKNSPTLLFPAALKSAIFIERPNRFLIRCARDNDQKQIIDAHVADPGRLKELLIPGRRVWLRPVNSPTRRTQWSVALCERPDGEGLVSIDATLPNRLIAKALQNESLEEFTSYSEIKPEFPVGGSRWDFLLTGVHKRGLLFEVKSVTLVDNHVGLFPDAVTTRGAKHVRTLSKLVREGRYDGAILFVIQRDDATAVQAARHIDPAFATAVDEARRSGVALLGRKCHVSLEGVSLGEGVPVL